MPENQETQPQGDQPKSASNPQQPARSGSADSLSASIQDMWLTANEQLVEGAQQQAERQAEREERQDSAKAILEGRELRNRLLAGSPTHEEQLAFYEEHWRETESLDGEPANDRALRRHVIDRRGQGAIRNDRANPSLEEQIIFASPHASGESLAGATQASQESSTSPGRQTPPHSRAMRIARKQKQQTEKRRNIEVQRNRASEEIDGPAR